MVLLVYTLNLWLLSFSNRLRQLPPALSSSQSNSGKKLMLLGDNSTSKWWSTQHHPCDSVLSDTIVEI